MRRFVPGVDSKLGSGFPPSIVRSSAVESGVAVAGRIVIEDIQLISDDGTTLIEKYRRLCYWRQVVNAENN